MGWRSGVERRADRAAARRDCVGRYGRRAGRPDYLGASAGFSGGGAAAGSILSFGAGSAGLGPASPGGGGGGGLHLVLRGRVRRLGSRVAGGGGGRGRGGLGGVLTARKGQGHAEGERGEEGGTQDGTHQPSPCREGIRLRVAPRARTPIESG